MCGAESNIYMATEIKNITTSVTLKVDDRGELMAIHRQDGSVDIRSRIFGQEVGNAYVASPEAAVKGQIEMGRHFQRELREPALRVALLCYIRCERQTW